MQKYRSMWTIGLLGLLLVPSIFSLLQPGFFETDDGSWMIIRFAAFYNSLIDLQIPVRMLEGLNFGYGYPVSNFLYPGYLYLASPLYFLGFGLVGSIKLILIVSLFGSGIATFFWLRRIMGSLPAFIGALLYVYTPYHLYDVYRRGSVGEVLALLFPPLILYCIERGNSVLVSLLVFLLLLSHNTLALLFLPLIIVYILIRRIKVKELLFATVYGVVLSSFFIIPALYELSYTNFSSITISNPLEYFADLKMVGVISFFALGASIIVLLIRRTFKNTPYVSLFLFFLLVSALSLFLSLPVSEFVWKAISSTFIQFPFRLLSVLLLGIAFIGGYSLFLLKGIQRAILAFVFVLVIAYSAYPYVLPLKVMTFTDEYYATNPATTTVQNEYMPKWVKKHPDTIPSQKVEAIEGNGVVENIVARSNKITFDFANAEGSTMRVHHLYYPGWDAYVNGVKTDISYDNELGAMDIQLKRDSGKVSLFFTETPVRLASNILTVVALCGLLLWVLKPLLKFK